MKTDRELLELAAKAAGELHLVPYKEEWVDDTTCEAWNPLKFDGDALRLAVSLNLIVGAYENYSSVSGTYSPNGYEVPEDISVWAHETEGNKLAATRRAIVRTAAAIGEKMP